MFDHRTIITVLLLAGALFFTGCDPARRLSDGEYLLDQNHIERPSKDSHTVDKGGLRRIIKQEPNRRIFWVRFHLAVHNLANNGNDSSAVRQWFMESVGEAPVVYDSTLAERSAKEMALYLRKKGYFHGTVEDSVVLNEKKQRAEVFYKVKHKQPYTIRDYNIKVDNPELKHYLVKADSQRVIKEGDHFDTEALNKERERITEFLRYRGYYAFNKEYIRFKVDSSVGKRKVDIDLRVASRRVNPRERPDTVVKRPHKKFHIDDVYINTAYYPVRKGPDTIPLDTLTMPAGYHVLYRGRLRFDPDLMVQSVFIRPDHVYRNEHEEMTYRRFADLRIFRSVNIRFLESKEDTGNTRLDCRILLTPAKTQSFSIESSGTNRGGNLGVSGSMSYSNRNMFQGAETFNITLNGGFESQKLLTSEEERSVVGGLGLNTIEVGGELSVDFPKFLLPVNPRKFSRSSNVSTKLSGSLDFQSRPDYERSITEFKMAYSWRETVIKRHMIHPIELSSIKVTKSRAFAKQLDELNDRVLLSSFRDHLIAGTGYTFILNDQQEKEQKNIFYYKGNADFAGNLLRGMHKTFDAPSDERGSFRLFNIRYAQFLRADHDLRYYRTLNSKSQLAYRLTGGVGFPYGNLDVLPFEKSFFVGGSNSMRAWQARTLGPGSFTDLSDRLRFDRIGDIRIETNLEYRFELLPVLEGALFLDAGNIWKLEGNEVRPEGVITADFYKEVAVGTGLGMRVNLDFFIIRLDLGVGVRDPALPEGERWVFDDKDQYHERLREYVEETGGEAGRRYSPPVNLNIGIGYPF